MKPSLRCFALIGILVSLGGVAHLKADSLILTSTSTLGAPDSSFAPPQFGGLVPGQHMDNVSITMAASLNQPDVTDSIVWNVSSGRVFSITPNALYTSSTLSICVSYDGSVKDSLGNLVELAAPTLTFTGLEGITAGEITGSGSTYNSAGIVQLLYTIDLPGTAFSFTGFTLSSALPGTNEPDTADFASLRLAAVYFTGLTSSSTDPGIVLGFEVIPEPSSVALLVATVGAGLAGIGSRRWKAVKAAR